MPAPARKLTVPQGATEVEIPKDWLHTEEIKDTHVTKEHFETEVKGRVERAQAGRFKPEELMESEDFLKTFVEKKKDPLMKLLDIKPTKDQIDVAKVVQETTEKVRREELGPAQVQLKTAGEEIHVLRVRGLDAQVAEAALRFRVRPDLLDLVKLYVRERADWDPERREWFIKKLDGTKGFETSLSSKAGGHPWMGVAEFLEKDSKSGEKKSWYDAATQAGPGYEGGPSGGGTMTLEQFQKLSPADQTKYYHTNPTEYMQFMSQIQKAGEDRLFAGPNFPAVTGAK